MTEIPASHGDLLESRALLFLATTMKDGTPQVSPVWFDTEGDFVRVNSAKGRLKDRNMRARPSVAFAISDPENPFRYLGVRGTVVEITEEGADAHIDHLAMKYMGVDRYPRRSPGEVRVIYKIRPDRVNPWG